MGEVREKIANKIYGDLQYDKREEFTFKDGGKIYIDFLGKFNDEKPVLFVIPGLTSDCQTGYIRNIA